MPVGRKCPVCGQAPMRVSAKPHAIAWRDTIRAVARQAFGSAAVLDQALAVTARFVFSRPKSHVLKSGRLAKGEDLVSKLLEGVGYEVTVTPINPAAPGRN